MNSSLAPPGRTSLTSRGCRCLRNESTLDSRPLPLRRPRRGSPSSAGRGITATVRDSATETGACSAAAWLRLDLKLDPVKTVVHAPATGHLSVDELAEGVSRLIRWSAPEGADHLINADSLLLFSLTPAILLQLFADVDQLDRVSGYEPEGRRFESCHPHHI